MNFSLKSSRYSAAFLISVLLPAHVKAQNVSCSELDQVAAASTSSFKSISKKEDFFGDGDVVEWLPSVYLPGATKCEVSVEDGGSYSCRFKTGTKPNSSEWGPSNLSFVLSQFQKWVAKCANYTGQPQFMDYQNPLMYKNRYPLQLRTRPVWGSGEIEFEVSPYEE